MEYCTSFQSLYAIELGESKDLMSHTVPGVKDNIDKKARYIKVIARKHERMAKWHSNDAVWMFIDEIIVE